MRLKARLWQRRQKKRFQKMKQYDIRAALALSEEFGRPLSEKEFKQFKTQAQGTVTAIRTGKLTYVNDRLTII
jgi:hypothetical protein